MTILSTLDDAADHTAAWGVSMASLKSLALICEVAILGTLLVTAAPWQVVAAAHLSLIGLLALTIAALELGGRSSGELLPFTLFLLVFGPLGGLAVLLSDKDHLRFAPLEFEDWYETIAPRATAAVTLADRIRDGRMVREQSGVPTPFQRLLSGGSMQEKQALLAYLASHDEPSVCKPALEQALKSADPRVRVQAAAVAAHNRTRKREVGAAVPTLKLRGL